MFKILFHKAAQKDFKQIDPSSREFIRHSLWEFAKNFCAEYERQLLQKGKIKKLKGYAEPLYRLRLRSYRVIYKKEEERLVILVLSVTTREGVYR